MMRRRTSVCVLMAVALLLVPAAARAQMTMGAFRGLATAHIGAALGNDDAGNALSVGGSVAVLEQSGWGAEFDFGYADSGDAPGEGLDAQSYMLNVIGVWPKGQAAAVRRGRRRRDSRAAPAWRRARRPRRGPTSASPAAAACNSSSATSSACAATRATSRRWGIIPIPCARISATGASPWARPSCGPSRPEAGGGWPRCWPWRSTAGAPISAQSAPAFDTLSETQQRLLAGLATSPASGTNPSLGARAWFDGADPSFRAAFATITAALAAVSLSDHENGEILGVALDLIDGVEPLARQPAAGARLDRAQLSVTLAPGARDRLRRSSEFTLDGGSCHAGRIPSSTCRGAARRCSSRWTPAGTRALISIPR